MMVHVLRGALHVAAVSGQLCAHPVLCGCGRLYFNQAHLGVKLGSSDPSWDICQSLDPVLVVTAGGSGGEGMLVSSG